MPGGLVLIVRDVGALINALATRARVGRKVTRPFKLRWLVDQVINSRSGVGTVRVVAAGMRASRCLLD